MRPATAIERRRLAAYIGHHKPRPKCPICEKRVDDVVKHARLKHPEKLGRKQ